MCLQVWMTILGETREHKDSTSGSNIFASHFKSHFLGKLSFKFSLSSLCRGGKKKINSRFE